MNRTRIAAALVTASVALIAPAQSMGATHATCSARMGAQRDVLVSRNHVLRTRLAEQRTELAGLRDQVTLLNEANAVLSAQVNALIVQVGMLLQAMPTS